MRRALPAVVVLLVLILVGFWLTSSDEVERQAPDGEPPEAAQQPPVRPATRPRLPAGFDEEAAVPPSERAATDGVDAGAGDGGLALSDEARKLGEAFARAQVEQWFRDNAETAKKRVDEYCEQTKEFAEREAPKRDRDAALFMAGRSDWEDKPPGLLHLPGSITDRMGNPPGAWRRMGPELYAGLDFTWMRELQQFDHWSIATASPLRDVAAAKSFADAPLPNFVTLQTWAKLRLLKGLHEGDLTSASAEVRHLAELCGSTGSLVGDMIRVAMFGIERGFIEEHQLQLTPAMNATQALRFRGADFAAIQFLLPGVPPEVREKALRCAPVKCTALVEAMGMTSMVRELLPGAREHLGWLGEQRPCDQALATMVSGFRPMPAGEIASTMLTRTLDENLELLKSGKLPP